MIRLYDTTRCPTAATCETCGSTDGLVVVTARTMVGVLCLTLCGRCRQAEDVPARGAYDAVRAVLAHCEHVGVTADQAAQMLAEEEL